MVSGAGGAPGGQRGARSCGAGGRVEPRASRAPSLSECSSFSPPTTVILLILLCFEGLLFLIFTSVMFGTQVHSICTDETVSTGAACHHSLHGWGRGAGAACRPDLGAQWPGPIPPLAVARGLLPPCLGLALWSHRHGAQRPLCYEPSQPPVMVQSCPRRHSTRHWGALPV